MVHIKMDGLLKIKKLIYKIYINLVQPLHHFHLNKKKNLKILTKVHYFHKEFKKTKILKFNNKHFKKKKLKIIKHLIKKTHF
jgi:hypothetical protein